jgi:hypothetical protein
MGAEGNIGQGIEKIDRGSKGINMEINDIIYKKCADDLSIFSEGKDIFGLTEDFTEGSTEISTCIYRGYQIKLLIGGKTLAYCHYRYFGVYTQMRETTCNRKQNSDIILTITYPHQGCSDEFKYGYPELYARIRPPLKKGLINRLFGLRDYSKGWETSESTKVKITEAMSYLKRRIDDLLVKESTEQQLNLSKVLENVESEKKLSEELSPYINCRRYL